MSSLQTLHRWSSELKEQAYTMPALFVGHGNPMNAIQHNQFTEAWQQLGNEMPKPAAIICISAHWLTKGTFVTAVEQPKTIHDFYGFPAALNEVEYKAPGHPALAALTKQTISQTQVELDYEWGYDHGSWSVIKHIYPTADVPMIELSIDYHQPAAWHYALAKELAVLRKKGVLIIGSGNMVHNLRMVTWDKPADYAFGWAIEANELFKNKILQHHHEELFDYEALGKAVQLAVPTPDHYYPMLYSLGLQSDKDKVTFFNDQPVMGSLTMTSFRLEEA